MKRDVKGAGYTNCFPNELHLGFVGVPYLVRMPVDLRAALQEKFGFESFYPGQEDVVSRVLRGQDTLEFSPLARVRA